MNNIETTAGGLDKAIEKLTPEGAERLATLALFLQQPWREANQQVQATNELQASRISLLERDVEKLRSQLSDAVRECKTTLDQLDAAKAQARKFHFPNMGDQVRVMVDKTRAEGMANPATALPKGKLIKVTSVGFWWSPDGKTCLPAVGGMDNNNELRQYLLDEVEPA